MKWISIKDQLPPIETEVLAFNGNNWMISGNTYYVAYYQSYKEDGSIDWLTCSASGLEDVPDYDMFTHWAKLPPRPQFHTDSCQKYGCHCKQRCDKKDKIKE